MYGRDSWDVLNSLAQKWPDVYENIDTYIEAADTVIEGMQGTVRRIDAPAITSDVATHAEDGKLTDYNMETQTEIVDHMLYLLCRDGSLEKRNESALGTEFSIAWYDGTTEDVLSTASDHRKALEGSPSYNEFLEEHEPDKWDAFEYVVTREDKTKPEGSD